MIAPFDYCSRSAFGWFCANHIKVNLRCPPDEDRYEPDDENKYANIVNGRVETSPESGYDVMI
jgi:hypothetical protein